MSKKNNGRKNSERPFKILLYVLIMIGIIGMAFCSLFFIINQININSAYQDLKNYPQNMVITRAEYIKELSEAQATASTKDLISLLYGFLSSAFISVGLYFLKESQQATKDTKISAEDVKEKYDKVCDYYNTISEYKQKIGDIAEKSNTMLEEVRNYNNEITDHYNRILENEAKIDIIIKNSNIELEKVSSHLEEQSRSVLLQTYIERAIMSCHFIELLIVMASDLRLFITETLGTAIDRRADIIAVIYRALPRIRDSLHWTGDLNISNSKMTESNIDILMQGVKEIELSFKTIIKYSRDFPELEQFNETWDEFIEYCNLIKKNLKEIRFGKGRAITEGTEKVHL
jgi:hypothetical protein